MASWESCEAAAGAREVVLVFRRVKYQCPQFQMMLLHLRLNCERSWNGWSSATFWGLQEANLKS